jgi:plasmid stabilization system protein ParE
VSPEVAERLLRDIGNAAERVAARPFAGSPRPNLETGLRSVRVAPHLVFYRIEAERIEFVRVLHERRDLAAAFDESGE